MKNTRFLTGLLFALFVSVVSAPLAAAHEFFVIPDVVKEYKSGDTVQIDALSTHYFAVGEELEDAAVNEVYVVKNGAKGAPLPLERNADRVWYQTNYRLTDNSPVIVVGNRKGGFYCLFTDGDYADGTRAEVTAANPGKTIATTRYFAKYSKLYLNPDAKDTSFSTPLGYDLEIIPLDNPAKLKKGSNAKFRVLYKGQPLTNAEISATYDYYNYRTANAYAKTSKTDAKGEVSFKIDASGLWFVRISDTRPSAYPNTDEDNNAAIVIFSIK
ncbi:nickel transporter [Spirochaetia bacterium]|nr:nickel transporter [Spirochaetia bacterium]